MRVTTSWERARSASLCSISKRAAAPTPTKALESKSFCSALTDRFQILSAPNCTGDELPIRRVGVEDLRGQEVHLWRHVAGERSRQVHARVDAAPGLRHLLPRNGQLVSGIQDIPVALERHLDHRAEKSGGATGICGGGPSLSLPGPARGKRGRQSDGGGYGDAKDARGERIAAACRPVSAGFGHKGGCIRICIHTNDFPSMRVLPELETRTA